MHHKSEEQLRHMSKVVGPERIAVMHGGKDQLFEVVLAKRMVSWIKPAEVQIMDEMGHGPIYEHAAWFNTWIEGWLDKVSKIDSPAAESAPVPVESEA